MLSWLSGRSTSPRSWNLNCSEQATVQPIAQNMIQKVKTVMQSHHQKSTKDHSSCSKDAHKLVTQVIKICTCADRTFSILWGAISCQESKPPSSGCQYSITELQQPCRQSPAAPTAGCLLLKPAGVLVSIPGSCWPFHFPHLPHNCSSGQCKTIL